MVVLNDGIILEEDETRAHSMLGKNTILPMSSMSRAIRVAKRVAYDSQSKHAVEAMLGNMRKDIVYKPLTVHIGAEIRLCGSRGIDNNGIAFMMRQLADTGKDMKALALLTNRIIEIRKEAIRGGGIIWTRESKSIFIELLVGKAAIVERHPHYINKITLDIACAISDMLKQSDIALAGIDENSVYITSNSNEQLAKEEDMVMNRIKRIGEQIE